MTNAAHLLRRTHAQAPALLCLAFCVSAIMAYILLDRANSMAHCLGIFSCF
jgi:hypothetical protein